MMPRGFFCNGYSLLNNDKMSKSNGNFLTIRDTIEKYGVDATRLTLADGGDGLDDANIEETVANASILKLFVFEKWIREEINKFVGPAGIDMDRINEEEKEHNIWDAILENEINYAIEHTTKAYNEMKFKQALKHGFFEI